MVFVSEVPSLPGGVVMHKLESLFAFELYAIKYILTH